MKYAPHEVVEYLDSYVIGQKDAKKTLAIALRNRDRLLRINDPDLQENIKRKNILLIGPTGVGKTEIITWACKIDNIPFVKADATKFTEVGYVGRDVESIIHDIIERSIAIQRKIRYENQNLDQKKGEISKIIAHAILKKQNITITSESVEKCIAEFNQGIHNDTIVEIEMQEKELDQSHGIGGLNLDISNNSSSNVTAIGVVPFNDLLKAFSGHKHKIRRLGAKKAFDMLLERAKSIDIDSDIVSDAIKNAEKNGIVFVDEIDKLINNKNNPSRGDISREGVQRDLLPLVEGTVIQTKYGAFKTNHVLFVAAGAFHSVKPSDLLPELQGRFPVQVKMKSLTKSDFIKILTVPRYNAIREIRALLEVDGIDLTFEDNGIEAIAEYAAKMNSFFNNTGARRLYGVLEKVTEEISFTANNNNDTPVKVVVDKNYVDDKMKGVFDINDNRKENYIF